MLINLNFRYFKVGLYRPVMWVFFISILLHFEMKDRLQGGVKLLVMSLVAFL